MIVATDIEIPDSCPKDCLGKKEIFGQGSLCISCPIFNCSRSPASGEYADEDGMFSIMEPKEYRKDWALVFQTWFKGDMKTFPKLLLRGEIK